jgi:hypothetical protein
MTGKKRAGRDRPIIPAKKIRAGNFEPKTPREPKNKFNLSPEEIEFLATLNPKQKKIFLKYRARIQKGEEIDEFAFDKELKYAGME